MSIRIHATADSRFICLNSDNSLGSTEVIYEVFLSSVGISLLLERNNYEYDSHEDVHCPIFKNVYNQNTVIVLLARSFLSSTIFHDSFAF